VYPAEDKDLLTLRDVIADLDEQSTPAPAFLRRIT
jgi:hypothetical protein